MKPFSLLIVKFVVGFTMKALTNKLFAILMALVLFITTSGFTVYEHQCSCTDTVTTLLFDDEADCCEKVTQSCCAQESHSCEQKDRDEDKDCCKSSPKYIKIDVPLELPAKVQSVSENFKLVPVLLTLLDDDFDEGIIQNNKYCEIPSIRHQGIRLILYHQQLKIAPPAA